MPLCLFFGDLHEIVWADLKLILGFILWRFKAGSHTLLSFSILDYVCRQQLGVLPISKLLPYCDDIGAPMLRGVFVAYSIYYKYSPVW